MKFFNYLAVFFVLVIINPLIIVQLKAQQNDQNQSIATDLTVQQNQIKEQTDQEQTDLETQKLILSLLKNKWYEKINLRGYAQFRYNRLFESNSNLKCKQCDRSIGDKQGFFMRRIRLIFSGEISNKLSFYLQPDFATAEPSGKQNFGQIRDFYFDYFLDSEKQFRLRGGISKIPFGFENLQSSSNRSALDRNDALNSAVPNERDIGVSLLWNSADGARIFKEVLKNNLKGSGDYGMVAIEAYNGQTLNEQERNNGLHLAMRLAYPWQTDSGQIYEISAQGYTGKFIIANKEYVDDRQALSFVMFPQPFGIMTEYNIGRGPEFQPDLNRVENDKLDGGYVQVMYQFNYAEQRFYPYARAQKYDGGKKGEAGTKYIVREEEYGFEWAPEPGIEFTFAYADSDRKTFGGEIGNTDQSGSLFRVQAQINY